MGIWLIVTIGMLLAGGFVLAICQFYARGYILKALEFLLPALVYYINHMLLADSREQLKLMRIKFLCEYGN